VADKEVDKIDARAFPFNNKNLSFINRATKEHSDLLLQSLGFFKNGIIRLAICLLIRKKSRCTQFPQRRVHFQVQKQSQNWEPYWSTGKDHAPIFQNAEVSHQPWPPYTLPLVFGALILNLSLNLNLILNLNLNLNMKLETELPENHLNLELPNENTTQTLQLMNQKDKPKEKIMFLINFQDKISIIYGNAGDNLSNKIKEKTKLDNLLIQFKGKNVEQSSELSKEHRNKNLNIWTPLKGGMKTAEVKRIPVKGGNTTKKKLTEVLYEKYLEDHEERKNGSHCI
jgi:hypothetical protein